MKRFWFMDGNRRVTANACCVIDGMPAEVRREEETTWHWNGSKKGAPIVRTTYHCAKCGNQLKVNA